jgi:putative membrane protein
MDIMGILVPWLITTISLLIISKMPLGIEIDGLGKAIIAAAVFGILNTLVRPILFWLTIPITILSLGIFLLVLNGIIFALAAALVQGFRLRWGFWSALLGALILSLINSIFFQLLGFIK